LPVLHIYTELPIDINNLAEQIKSKFIEKEKSNLAIFYDVRYHKAFVSNKSVFEQIENLNIFICEPSTELGENVQCGRICPENLDSDWKILFVGQNENFALLLGLTFAQCSGHFMIDPKKFENTNSESQKPLNAKIEESSINVKKALMKRYYLIERARW